MYLLSKTNKHMNHYESDYVIPKIALEKLTLDQVQDRITADELTLYNELVDELEKGIQDADPRWEHYDYLHKKALGLNEEKPQSLAA